MAGYYIFVSMIIINDSFSTSCVYIVFVNEGNGVIGLVDVKCVKINPKF